MECLKAMPTLTHETGAACNSPYRGSLFEITFRDSIIMGHLSELDCVVKLTYMWMMMKVCREGREPGGIHHSFCLLAGSAQAFFILLSLHSLPPLCPSPSPSPSLHLPPFLSTLHLPLSSLLVSLSGSDLLVFCHLHTQSQTPLTCVTCHIFEPLHQLSAPHSLFLLLLDSPLQLFNFSEPSTALQYSSTLCYACQQLAYRWNGHDLSPTPLFKEQVWYRHEDININHFTDRSENNAGCAPRLLQCCLACITTFSGENFHFPNYKREM